MRVRARPSSRQPYPLRMPPSTYWRPPEPAEEVIGYALAAGADLDEDPEALDEKPEVTSPEWVAWVEQELVLSRAEAAVATAPESGADREAPEPRVPPAPSKKQVPLWQRAQELEAALDARGWQRMRELEAELDVRRRRTARTRRLVAVAAVVVLALGAGAWWWSRGGDGTDDTDAQRATTAAANVVEAPAPPVELLPGTGHTEVRVLDSGELAVQQWVRGSRPLSGLDLSPPAFEATPGDVRVIGLRVVAGATRVRTPDSLTEPTVLTFDPAPWVYLRYRIAGALERSGSDGRALAWATSLNVGYDGATGDGDTIAFRNATLLSLACTPLRGDGVPLPCGAEAGASGWRVVPPPAVGDVQVMAQLDLLSPG